MPSVSTKRTVTPMLELQRVITDGRRNDNSTDEKPRQQIHGDRAARLNALRLNNLFCDVQLQFGKGSQTHRRVQYSAHKILLTTVSDYFLELFCGMPRLQIVYFPHLDASAFDTLLSYSYLARVDLSVEQASRFLRAASLLRFDPECIERCATFLRDNLTVGNVLEVRQSLSTTDTSPPIVDLRNRANSFIRAHVTELIEHILAHANSSGPNQRTKSPVASVHESASQTSANDAVNVSGPRTLPSSYVNGESDTLAAASTLLIKLKLTLNCIDQLGGASQTGTASEGSKTTASAAYRELAGLVLRWLADFTATSRCLLRQLGEDSVLRLALDDTNRISLIEVPMSSKLGISPSGQWTSSSLASLTNWDLDSDVESIRDKSAEQQLDAESVHVTNGDTDNEVSPVATATTMGMAMSCLAPKNSVTDSALEFASARMSSSSRSSLCPCTPTASSCEINEYESPLGDGTSLLETSMIAVHVEPDHTDRLACLALLQSKLVLMSICLDTRKESSEADDDADTTVAPRDHNGFMQQNGCENQHAIDVNSLTLEEPMRTNASRHSSSSGSTSPSRTSAPQRRTLTLEPLSEMSDARCGHACVALRSGRQLAALGGYNRDRCLSSVELFDLASNNWTPLGTMCSSRARFGACLLGDLLLACGGSDGSADLRSCEVLNMANLGIDGNANPIGGFRNSPDVPESQTRRLRFEQVECMNYARSSHAVAALDDRAYVIGGNAGNMDLCVLELYDPIKDEWIVGPSLRCERSQPAVCADERHNCLYALGGSRQGSPLLNTIERYDPREPAWHLLDCRLPSARRGAAAICSPDGFIYVVGGHNGSQALRTVEVLDPRNFSILPAGSLNVARTNVACCMLSSKPTVSDSTEISGDLLMALGGFSGKQFLGSLEFYDTETQRWSVYKPARCSELRNSPSAQSLRRPNENGSGSQPPSMSVSMTADTEAHD